MRHPKQPAPDRPTYGAIAPDELLPLPVVKQRLHWGNETIAKAQREGLRTLTYGKWKYVIGRDLILFLERAGANGQQAAGEQGGNKQA